MAILHDDLLYQPDLIRFHAMKQIVARCCPGVPVVDHQLDSCLVGQPLHFASIRGIGRHGFFGGIVNVTLGTLAQNLEMAIKFRSDEYCFGLGFVEHLDVVGIELHGARNLRPGLAYQVGMRIGNRHELRFWLGRNVFQELPDMIVVETDNGKAGFSCRSWRLRIRRERQVREQNPGAQERN